MRFARLTRPRQRWVAYGVSLLAPLVAYAVQSLIWAAIPPSPYLLFYPAVFLVAWWAGKRPAALATALSCVLIAYGFLGPPGDLRIEVVRDAVDLTIFAGVSLVIARALDRLHQALDDEHVATERARAANRAKDEILAIVSHDLRNPLTAIALLAKRLRDRPTDENNAALAARVERLVQTAEQLVDDILTFAREDAGTLTLELSPCSTRELVEQASDAAAPTARARNILVETRVDDASVLCDRSRVQQILSNLIGNALKFTPPGGTISLQANARHDAICFEVSDTGPGVPPELRERIFDRYFSGGGRSAGLGLHIARTLVEAQQGKIGVNSNVGVGSTFWFTLPVAAPRASRPPERQGRAFDVGRGVTARV